MAKELITTDDFDFDIMPVVIVFAIVAALAPMLQQMQAQLKAQAYHGVEDTRTLHATNILQWINLIHGFPYTSWISAYFINDGPNAVEIGINYPDKGFTMNPHETITVNRTGALDERISVVYYKCGPGLTASVRVTGTY